MFEMFLRLQGPLLLVMTCTAGAFVVSVVLVRRVRALAAQLATATRMRNTAGESDQASTRRIQLAAHDLRGIGMSLQGHADQLIAANHASAAGLATAAADLLDMADDMQGQGVDAGGPRVLRAEQIALATMIREAVTAVTLAIAPGRRNWRVSKEFDDYMVNFDPRALRHMLRRVLADAVRNTRQDDWIDISQDRIDRDLTVIVADEGVGNATPELGKPVMRDSRGIGLRLSLARALMIDHGGRVDIEAHVGVGTRVTLVFPAARVRRRLAAA